MHRNLEGVEMKGNRRRANLEGRERNGSTMRMNLEGREMTGSRTHGRDDVLMTMLTTPSRRMHGRDDVLMTMGENESDPSASGRARKWKRDLNQTSMNRPTY